MSVATGILQSYQAEQTNCKNVLIGAAVVASLYALSLGILRPNIERKEQIFYATLAAIVACAMIVQVFVAWTGSKDMQDAVRIYTVSTAMATSVASQMLSFYYIAIRLKSIVGAYCKKEVIPKEDNLYQNLMNIDTYEDLDLNATAHETAQDTPEKEIVHESGIAHEKEIVHETETTRDILEKETAHEIAQDIPEIATEDISRQSKIIYTRNNDNINPLEEYIEDRSSLL